VLKRFFEDLRGEWEHSVVNQLEASTDASTAELVRARIAPQLALFVADDSTLALYREFLFPSIPSTGFLPAGNDEIRTPDRATKPMAIDVALSKAAVVIYDENRRNPIALDYVISRRDGAPTVVLKGAKDLNRVEGPDYRVLESPEFGYRVLEHSESMNPGSWQESLLEPLMTELRLLKDAARPDSLFTERLSALRSQIIAPKGEDEDDQSVQIRIYTAAKQVLLACLALLESHLRTEMDPIQDSGPSAGSAAPQGRISRMRKHFGKDFNVVIKAIQLRHALLQQLDVSTDDISKSALEVYSVARTRIPDLP
jgi:hypothetical protein